MGVGAICLLILLFFIFLFSTLYMQKIYYEGSENVSKSRAYNLLVCNVILTVLIGFALLYYIILYTRDSTEQKIRDQAPNEVSVYNIVDNPNAYGDISKSLYNNKNFVVKVPTK